MDKKNEEIDMSCLAKWIPSHGARMKATELARLERDERLVKAQEETMERVKGK